LNFRHASHSSDQKDLVDFTDGDVWIFDAVFAGFDGSLEEVVCEGLEFGSGQFEDEVFGACGVGCEEGQVDFGLSGLG